MLLHLAMLVLLIGLFALAAALVRFVDNLIAPLG